ncbi:MAG TPA: hypothetical protein VJV23_14250 [Candidatus Polarisedimenticolia bacterium]|nr:hypothetical protein [Candidatus Polarisedimenticolia bacterium]
MTRRAGNLLSLCAGIAAALALSEGTVRVLWRDAPRRAGAPESLPLVKVRDPRVLYRLLPGSSGLYLGTEIRVNSMGLRGPDRPIPRPQGAWRVLVLGDSMVFGIGLPEEETLPAHLQRRIAPAEAINAGVFGYNLPQQVSLLEEAGLRYGPQVVVACFVHNDVENWGLGDGGAVPEIRSTRFAPPPAGAWSSRAADLMLPGTFDEQRLNLLPGPAEGGGVRAALASFSRLYLFTYLRLRTHAWNMTTGETREPLIDSPACHAQEVVWGPLRSEYRRLALSSAAAGAKLVVVIHGALPWEGEPLRRLGRLLQEESIPHLDLSPLWKDPETYAREHSLGWDPHPNGRANRLAAGVIAGYLEQAGLLPGGRSAGGVPGPHSVLEGDPALRQRLRQWRERQSGREQQDAARWARAVASFGPEIAFAEQGAAARSAQLVHGFWLDSPPPLPRGEPGGLWMARSGSVLLRTRGTPGRVAIDLTVPKTGGAGAVPSRLQVTLSAPPGRCGVTRMDLPLGAPGSRITLHAPLPAELAGAEPLEVELAADHTFPATHLDGRDGRRDPRMVSVLLRRIAVE